MPFYALIVDFYFVECLNEMNNLSLYKPFPEISLIYNIFGLFKSVLPLACN